MAPPNADLGLTVPLGTIRYIRKNPNPCKNIGSTCSTTVSKPGVAGIHLLNTVEPR